MEKVKGISFYQQPNVTELAGEIDESGDLPTFYGKAVLYKEPTNPYDANAVQVHGVRTDGSLHIMGHLGRDGELYQKMLEGVIPNGTEVGLRIVGYSSIGLSDSYQIELPIDTVTYHAQEITPYGTQDKYFTTKKEIETVIQNVMQLYSQSPNAQGLDLRVVNQLANKVDIKKNKDIALMDATGMNGLRYTSSDNHVTLQLKIDQPAPTIIIINTVYGKSVFGRPIEG